MINAIIPVSEVVDNTKTKYPYRNLNKGEIDLLISLYDKYNGNIAAVSRDEDCPFKSTGQLFYYKKIYNFEAELERFRAERVKLYRENAINRLSEAKLQLINKVFELLYPKEIEIPINGQLISILKEPTYKELEAAYRIIKTELGEPTSITKNENSNTDQGLLEKYRHELKEIGEYVKTQITIDSPGD